MKRLTLFTIALLAIFSVVGTAQRRAPRAVAFKVDKIYLGDDRVISPGTILVKAGKIVAVGQSIEIPKGTRTIRRKGFTITPGLVDAAAEGVRPSTEQIAEVIPGYGMADCLDLGHKRIEEMASEGVTAAFLTAPDDAVIGCRGAVIKTGRLGRLLDKDGAPKLTVNHSPSRGNRGPSRFSGISIYTRRPTSQMGVIFVARDAMTKAKNLLAKKTKTQDPHMKVLQEVVSGKRVIRVRAEEQYEIAAAVRLCQEFGLKPIFENSIEAWRMTRQLSALKAPVILGPIIPPEERPAGRFGRGPQPRLRSDVAQVLSKKGIQFALTAGRRSGERSLARQAEFAVRHGLPRVEAVKATTSVPAKLIGHEKSLGLLAAGRAADFVLWNGEPFAATSRPATVFVDGIAVAKKSH